jgi:outer membrane protein assembly factor BamB
MNLQTKFITQRKTLSTAVLILLLALPAFAASLPTINAHTPPWTLPTFAYLAISPNPVGVGETAILVMWVSPNPPTALGNAGDRWRDMTVDVTKPDGTTQKLGPFTSDPTGSTYTLYTPDQLGTYTFLFKYPGQVMSLTGPNGLKANAADLVSRGTDVYVNDTFTASSAITSMTVQQAPIPKIPDTPMPTSYWTRPIEGGNSAWASLAANWLGGAQILSTANIWQPDGLGPNSAHILWTKPMEFGGITGTISDIPGVGFYSGGSYEGRFQNAIIMYGRLYYADPLGHSSTGGGYTCVDLQTGEVIWHRDDLNVYSNPNPTALLKDVVAPSIPAPTFGQLYDYESPNQHGVVGGILWQTSTVSGVTTWQGFDAFTGKWVFNETYVPSGTEVYTTDGEIVRYQLSYNRNTRSGWLALWNNTQEQMGLHLGLGTTTNAWQWRPDGKSVNMSTAYSWNVSITADLSGLSAPSIVRVIPGDMILGVSTTFTRFYGTPNPYTFWAISDKPSTRGQLLWIKNYTAPEGGINRCLPGGNPVDTTNRIFFMQDTETFQWLGYSLDTGNLVWGPVGSNFRAFQYYGSGSGGTQRGFVAYGNLYVQSFGGEIHCYSGKDGKLLWKYNNTNSGVETAWGNYPIFIAAIGDGKVYAFNNEHSPNYPLYKGERVRCIDAYTGEELWTVLSWAGQTGGGGNPTGVLAEGVFAYYNYYDNQLYAIGRGPSATTVSAPQTVISKGTGVLLTGIVIDKSSGAKKLIEDNKFNVVPAMSDASMGTWMEYLYMQKPKPANATGVSVKLTAYDPNGNSQNIGSTTTDINGKYAITWTPTLEGTYYVVAEFEGSNSYWSSQDTTYFAVGPASAVIQPTVAPTTTATVAPTVAPTATASPSPVPNTGAGLGTEVYIAIAAAAVIAIVAAAAALILRKHK